MQKVDVPSLMHYNSTTKQLNLRLTLGYSQFRYKPYCINNILEYNKCLQNSVPESRFGDRQIWFFVRVLRDGMIEL